ncbi:MAG: hypothetical protein ABIS06_12780 [Vicinamibacterales bacterium]
MTLSMSSSAKSSPPSCDSRNYPDRSSASPDCKKLQAVQGPVGDLNIEVALLQQAVDTRESLIFGLSPLPEMAVLVNDPRAVRTIEQADAMRKGKRWTAQ